MLNNEITPNRSIGGICLGQDIYEILDRLDKQTAHPISIPSDSCVKIGNALIDIYFDPESGRISQISCGADFHGFYKTKKGRIKAGMSVADILQNTATQTAWGGFVKVDGLHGIGFPLPDGYDDFSKLTDFLDYGFVFPELSVYPE